MQSLQRITMARILKNVFGKKKKKRNLGLGHSCSVQPALNGGFTMPEYTAVICVLRFD